MGSLGESCKNREEDFVGYLDLCGEEGGLDICQRNDFVFWAEY